MMEAKIAPWKTHVVANVVELLKTPGTIAIIDTAGVPADLFLGMRAKLREDLTLKIMKKTLIRLAWKEAGLDISLIEEALDTSIQPAIVHSTTLSALLSFHHLMKQEMAGLRSQEMLHQRISLLKHKIQACLLGQSWVS